MLKKALLSLTTILGAFALMVTVAHAATLENAYLTLSNAAEGASGVTHTVTFTHAGSNLGAVKFSYCTLASGGCTAPASFDSTNAAKGVVTESGGDVAADWSISSTANVVTLTRSDVDTNAANTWVFGVTTLDNANTEDCTQVANTSSGTCYVRIVTYSDTAASTAADTSTVSYTVTNTVTVTATVDPSFTLNITGIDPTATTKANQTTLTTAVTPTFSSIPFGNLSPGTAKYAAQSLTVTTNASGGYVITAIMNANMTGNAYGDDIDQFAETGVSQTAAVSWTSPTGSASGTNTGWLGIGTDDTDVSGQAQNEFFPLGTSLQTIASQASSASSEEDVVVVGIEVNAYQQADSYTGILRYNALPTY